MKTILAVAVFFVAYFAYDTWAHPNGNFEVKVHFVPAILRDNCTAGMTWKPKETEHPCAQCLCIANRLSRCVPVRKCDPSKVNSTMTTTTAATGESTTTTTVAPGDPAGAPVEGEGKPVPGAGGSNSGGSRKTF